MSTASEVRTARAIRVTGLVQGVGFRPFVYRLAARHELAGSVRNAAGEVEIVVEGEPAGVDAFLRELREEAPPLARIDRIDWEPAPVTGVPAFAILSSTDAPDRRQPVSPDVAICPSCTSELFDPGDRRYRYPFITCTDCGPRFTVIAAMPYDRERTSMRAFIQCPDCRSEYTTPGNRRFHSETNSCPRCGPRLWLEQPGEAPTAFRGAASIRRAAELLRAGSIVAIRGLGGFHLAVDATADAAVTRLRTRKVRDAKPLAVMVRTLEQARLLGNVGPFEEALLTSPEQPIVLLRRRPDCGLAGSVAPDLDTVGVMLAYTPLHHLLLDAVGKPLVMTSGNRSEEPISTSNADARDRLRWIADAFLMHDRDIISRYDDSVVRAAGAEPIMLRRGRGYAPFPVQLPVASPVGLLATGAQLKNTFTLVHGSTAYTSQHIGDLDDAETLEHWLETLRLYRRLFRIEVGATAHDLHPDFFASQLAPELAGRDFPVQHHHAHAAAVLAEHGWTGSAIAVTFDGAGYGEDGNTWGGEFLIADLTRYRRVGQLRYLPLPGGDLAARRPWRSALGALSLAPEADRAFHRAFVGIEPRELNLAAQQIRHHLNAPLASSMGRLFDAAAAVLGVRQAAAYEGQAGMELEALAGDRPAEPLPFPVSIDSERWVLDPVPLLVALGERRDQGHPVEDLAAAFHESVAAATTRMVRRIAQSADLTTVALAGGVFQNARLLASVRDRLEASGFTVLTSRLLPPNDGGISYGQAAVAAARLAQDQGGLD